MKNILGIKKVQKCRILQYVGLLIGLLSPLSSGENLLDTLIYHGLSSNTLLTPIYFGYKFTPCYPCTLLAGWVFTFGSHSCTLLVYDWPPDSSTLIEKVPFTTTTYWNVIELPTPYFDRDTFFVAFHFDGSTYLETDFGPSNGRGYYSSDGITWFPTNIGNNAFIRATVLYNIPSKDAAVKSIDYPGHLFPPGSVVTPVATVKNTGRDTISFDVTCTVDTSGIQVYSSTKSVVNLPPDSTYQVTFDEWSPTGSGYPCLLKVVTQLATDSLPANDTLKLTTTPYAPITIIPSGWAPSPPTIDGTIDTTSEWKNAYCIDVSDLDGRYGKPEPARTIYLYVMNDSSCLYLAVDYHTIFHEEYNSRFYFYFDEDNNGAWASDGSEGYYELYVHPSLWNLFHPLPSGSPVNVTDEVPDARVDEPYHLTYEVAIPFHETNKWLLNVSPGDTVGFHCFMHSQDARYNWRWPMWWPTLMDSLHQEEPEYYGKIVLASPVTIREKMGSTIDWKISDNFTLEIYPNLFRDQVTIKWHFKKEGKEISLKIYDAYGRVVKQFSVDCSLSTSITWDGKDDSGRKVKSGVYFLRFETGNQKFTRKVLLLRQ